jgi:hypothetical protein
VMQNVLKLLRDVILIVIISNVGRGSSRLNQRRLGSSDPTVIAMLSDIQG